MRRILKLVEKYFCSIAPCFHKFQLFSSEILVDRQIPLVSPSVTPSLLRNSFLVASASSVNADVGLAASRLQCHNIAPPTNVACPLVMVPIGGQKRYGGQVADVVTGVTPGFLFQYPQGISFLSGLKNDLPTKQDTPSGSLKLSVHIVNFREKAHRLPRWRSDGYFQNKSFAIQPRPRSKLVTHFGPI